MAGKTPARAGEKLSGLRMAGIPIEDLAWYAYSAALFGTYYKYATGQRLVGRDGSPSLHHFPLAGGGSQMVRSSSYISGSDSFNSARLKGKKSFTPK